MVDEMPRGVNACAVQGCWETMVVHHTRYCNTHRRQRQPKYQQTHNTPAPAECDEDQYKLKQDARRTCESLQAYVSWVEEHGARKKVLPMLYWGRASPSPERFAQK